MRSFLKTYWPLALILLSAALLVGLGGPLAVAWFLFGVYITLATQLTADSLTMLSDLGKREAG